MPIVDRMTDAEIAQRLDRLCEHATELGIDTSTAPMELFAKVLRGEPIPQPLFPALADWYHASVAMFREQYGVVPAPVKPGGCCQ